MITFYVSSYGKNDDKGIYIINLKIFGVHRY